MNSDMSFAVSCRKTGYEYSSRGVRGFFAQKRNVLSATPWKLFGEIKRFNREAVEVLKRPELEALKLGEFLDQKKFSSEFRDLYLVPMAAAVWSCAPRAVNEFPAATLIRFFDNHRFLTDDRTGTMEDDSRRLWTLHRANHQAVERADLRWERKFVGSRGTSRE